MKHASTTSSRVVRHNGGMWFFTASGFLSVVQHQTKSQTLVVRFRVLEDAQTFLAMLSEYERKRNTIGPPRRVKSTPERDYPYRFEVSRKRFGRFMGVFIAEAITYPNFKSAVATKQGVKRANVYHDVWQLLQDGLDLRFERSFVR